MALGDDLVADRGVERAVHVVQQQRPRVAVARARRSATPGARRGRRRRCPVRAAQTSAIRSARSRRATKPRICAEALVEPLRVVDDADERLLLGDLGEQRQRGEPDQEPVRRRAGAQAEHRRERVALRGGQPVEVIQHRGAELMQAAVGAAPSPTRRPPPSRRASRRPVATGGPAARSCRRPPRPRSTTTPLRPASASVRSRSSASHSARRPRSTGAAPAVSAATLGPTVDPATAATAPSWPIPPHRRPPEQ